MTGPVWHHPARSYGLGRLIEHDPRSLAYEVPMLLPRPEPVLWPRYGPVLDQGNLGACTGFAMAAWLQCAPGCSAPLQASAFGPDLARSLYSRATELDRFPGQWPPDDTGSSGLAVAKAAKRLGLIAAYRWAFSWSGLLHALQVGPVIVGVPWFEGMFDPDPDGVVVASGPVVGGHEFLVRGTTTHFGALHLVCDNSWGPGWADHGTFYLSQTTWQYLAANKADVTAPVPLAR